LIKEITSPYTKELYSAKEKKNAINNKINTYNREEDKLEMTTHVENWKETKLKFQTARDFIKKNFKTAEQQITEEKIKQGVDETDINIIFLRIMAYLSINLTISHFTNNFKKYYNIINKPIKRDTAEEVLWHEMFEFIRKKYENVVEKEKYEYILKLYEKTENIIDSEEPKLYMGNCIEQKPFATADIDKKLFNTGMDFKIFNWVDVKTATWNAQHNHIQIGNKIFTKGKLIKKGRMSEVYKYENGNDTIAVKIPIITTVNGITYENLVEKSIIENLEVYHIKGFLCNKLLSNGYVVMPFVNGDLSSIKTAKMTNKKEFAKLVILGVYDTINLLYNNTGFIYSDTKPENTLFKIKSVADDKVAIDIFLSDLGNVCSHSNEQKKMSGAINTPLDGDKTCSPKTTINNLIYLYWGLISDVHIELKYTPEEAYEEAYKAGIGKEKFDAIHKLDVDNKNPFSDETRKKLERALDMKDEQKNELNLDDIFRQTNTLIRIIESYIRSYKITTDASNAYISDYDFNDMSKNNWTKIRNVVYSDYDLLVKDGQTHLTIALLKLKNLVLKMEENYKPATTVGILEKLASYF
jgi:hypothetical protein